MLFNSAYQPTSSTGGVLGTSLVDLTSVSFADLFAQAADYDAGVTYNKGTLVYNQNTIWVYVNATAASGNAPPTLPTISNTYWELVGSAGTFTWIAYASSADGATNFTTGTYDNGGTTRTYIGIAHNKTTATESTNYTDYAWSKFVGVDGTSPLIYDIITSAPVIVKDAVDAATSGSYSSITIQGKRYNGNTTTNYGWVTVTANGDTEAATATDTSAAVYTLSPTTTAGKSSYTVKLYNQATVSGAILLDTQSVPVVFKGAPGSGGINARAVSLSAATQAFAYDSSGATPSPTSSVLTAVALNTSGTVYYEFIVDGTSVQNTTTNTYTYTPQALFANMPDTIRVNIREGGTGTTILASDSIVTTGLKNTVNGVDALTTVVSNSAHTLPTTNAGVVTYTGSGTTIRLYEGTTELLYDGLGTSNGSWKVIATGTNITPGGLTDSGNYVTVAAHSAITATNASISYNITGKRANGTAIDITVLQTFSKSTQGDNGVSSVTAILSNETHSFPASNSGTVSSYVGSGTLIRVYEGATELAYDGIGTSNGSWTVSAVPTNITVGSVTDSGSYATVGQHSGVADATDTSSITYNISGKTSTGQTISITKVQTFTKSKAGTSGTRTATLQMYQWASTAPTLFPVGTSTYTWATGAFTAPATTNSWTLSPGTPSAGQTLYSVTQVFSDTLTSTTSSVTWSATTSSQLGYAGSNGNPGSNGTRTAVLDVYQWAASSPTTYPSGTSTYTWSTGQFTAPTTLNSWTLVPGTPSAGQTLYIARQIYSDTLTTTTSSVTWSASYSIPSGVAGSNGAPGSNGQRVGVLEVYLWSSTAPTTYPSGTSTYTWATGAFTAPTTANSWSLTPGAAVAGQTLWGISVSVSDNLTTATSTATWNSVTAYAVGYAGSNGSPGTAAVTATLSNDATSLFAYADGTVVSFSPANGLFKVYSGTTDVTSSATSFSATASGCTGTINTAASTPVSGQPIGYYQVTAMSGDTATLTLSAIYGGTTLTKVYTLSKTKGGYEIVGTLPATNLFQGRMVFLTTDSKLYRYTGSAWTTAVPAVDISGTLADAQIAAVAASKVTGTLSDSQLAGISAAKISGTITTTQITDGAISTAKIAAAAITSNEIAANTIVAADIAAGTITGTEIAAATITGAKIAAGTVAASNIAANTITASQIAADTITAAQIAADAITANELSAGAVTAAKISVTQLSAISATIGTLRTASTGARTEISDNVIKVYDAGSVLRVKIGNLAL